MYGSLSIILQSCNTIRTFLCYHSCANSRAYINISLVKITSLANTYTETKSSVWTRTWIISPTEQLAHCLALAVDRGHTLIPAASSVLSA